MDQALFVPLLGTRSRNLVIPEYITAKRDLTPGGKLVLTSIVSHGGRRKGFSVMESFPAQNTIARETGLSRVHVCSLVRDLRNRGYFKVVHRPGTSNVYAISDYIRSIYLDTWGQLKLLARAVADFVRSLREGVNSVPLHNTQIPIPLVIKDRGGTLHPPMIALPNGGYGTPDQLCRQVMDRLDDDRKV